MWVYYVRYVSEHYTRAHRWETNPQKMREKILVCAIRVTGSGEAE